VAKTMKAAVVQGPSVSLVDYPAQWERVAYTRDGVEYRIRPIRADDAPRDRAFIIRS